MDVHPTKNAIFIGIDPYPFFIILPRQLQCWGGFYFWTKPQGLAVLQLGLELVSSTGHGNGDKNSSSKI